MRDAFGGSFMIKLFLVFIAIYMIFTAMALNYAKAFKVKNKVIEYLETNEVATIKNMDAESFSNMSNYFEKEILGKLNYHIDKSQMNCNDTVYCDNGIAIYQIEPNTLERNKLGAYYRVETYFAWNLGFLKNLTALSGNNSNGSIAFGTWRISGETRPIVNEK